MRVTSTLSGTRPVTHNLTVVPETEDDARKVEDYLNRCAPQWHVLAVGVYEVLDLPEETVEYVYKFLLGRRTKPYA